MENLYFNLDHGILTIMHYSFDLHLHTFFSKDAVSSPESMIAAAKQRGLSGIAITDHDTCEGVEYLRRQGFLRNDGEAVDHFLIIPGVEVSTREGHLLCLGTTLPFMKGHPAKKVVEEIQKRGGLAIAPHSFDRFRAGIHQEILNDLPLAALETFNAAVSLKRFNEQAANYAKERNLPATAASDAHHASAVGISSTSYDLQDLSLSALLEAIPQGGVLTKNYLPLREAMKKNFGNWFRILNPQPSPIR